MRWWKGLLLTVVLLLVMIGLVAWWAAPRPIAVVSPKGFEVTLLEYHFTSNRFEYRYPKRFLFERLLPKPVRQKLDRTLAKSAFVRPANPGEPMLSCAMLVRVPQVEHGFTGRLLIAD